MSEINDLAYFLNSIKEILPFEDEKDFKEKISESKEFRIRVQKLVYLSKFFGWNNNYHFNFHKNGHYSCRLSEDYHKITLKESNEPVEIDSERFGKFIKNRDNDYLESSSSLLYYANSMNLEYLNKQNTLRIIKILKPHLSEKIISQSFDNILKFDLLGADIDENYCDNLNNYEKIVRDKSKGLMDIFENYEISSNRLFLLGTLDYFRFVLENADLNDKNKWKLLDKLYDYAENIEKRYFKYHPTGEELVNMDLSGLKHDFDMLQDYVSDTLEIIPRLDENTDLSIFF